MMPPRPASRALTAAKVRRLLEEPGVAPDPEVSERASIPAHALPGGGSLLVFEDGAGRLYEDRRELLAMLGAVEAERPEHLLAGRLPRGSSFADHVPALIGRLAQELDIDPSSLDGSIESLEQVDERLNRLSPARRLEPDLFEPLVAYAGEVVRRLVGGEWEIRRAADGETWEPWVRGGDRRDYAPFAAVFRALEERPVSIQGAIAGQVARWPAAGTGVSEIDPG